jgi:exoribonuclease-2
MEKGKILDYWESGIIAAGAFIEESKGRLKVLSLAGRFVNITESRLMHVSDRVIPVGDPERAAALLKEYEAQATEISEKLNLAPLWELLSPEGGEYEIEEISSLLLDSRDGISRSAVLRALVNDAFYFSRKDRKFSPKSAEVVEEAFKRERARKRKAEARETFAQALAVHLRGKPGDAETAREIDTSLINLLKEAAAFGPVMPQKSEVLSMLAELRERVPGIPQGAPEQVVFWILRKLGIFKEDENLFLIRAKVPTSFPEAIRKEAVNAARVGLTILGDRPPPQSGKVDLRELEVFSIDDEETAEVDDALSLETIDAAGDLFALGIHIADPGHFIGAGTPLDQEALHRSTSIYLPERRITMLPPEIAEEAASLKVLEDRPALSFSVELTSKGEIRRFSIAESIIRVKRRLSYREVDTILEGEPDPLREPLFALKRLADALMAMRMKAGARIIKSREPDVMVSERGEISIRIIDPSGPARLLVSEMMILVNGLTARFLAENSIPAIFRIQQAPDAAPPASDRINEEPHEVFAARRLMKPASLSLEPGPHAGLGLEAYVQATSPLRRYQDLAGHRQLKSHLRGGDLQYSREELQTIAATTEGAERTARDLERSTEEYWILKYLSGKIGQALDAVVVFAEPRKSLVLLTDLYYIAALLPSPVHYPGLRLKVILDEANPRAAKIFLREA